MARQLQVDPATRDYPKQRGIAVRVAETREAVKIYNELAARGPGRGAVRLHLLTPGRRSYAPDTGIMHCRVAPTPLTALTEDSSEPRKWRIVCPSRPLAPSAVAAR